MSDWIKVQNYLPPYDTDVWVTNGKEAWISTRTENHCTDIIEDDYFWHDQMGNQDFDITHWQNLPELPE